MPYNRKDDYNIAHHFPGLDVVDIFDSREEIINSIPFRVFTGSHDYVSGFWARTMLEDFTVPSGLVETYKLQRP